MTPNADAALGLLWATIRDRGCVAVLEVDTSARTNRQLLAASHPIVTARNEFVRRVTALVAGASSNDPAGRARMRALGALAIHAT